MKPDNSGPAINELRIVAKFISVVLVLCTVSPSSALDAPETGIPEPTATAPQSTAGQAEARAIYELASAIRQAEARVHEMQEPIDDVALNLDRPTARATGSVSGWRRAVREFRAELARLRERHAGLRTDALNAERGERASAAALRTYRDLGRRLQQLQEGIDRLERSIEEVQARMREPDVRSVDRRPESAGLAATGPPNLSGVWLEGKNG